ncbi:hypothetical protein [Candidatus Formimonas warabiya]|uniref:Uncharacterized protein n=1 Tax=Formimonas warabiya TaxID=1761012 RepID=A0A3G1KX61_FORW1|nr:hypothetical protein [Candidatus Formimonas warabiya]ATW27000.1 hypothetical protein DCMF_21535 [Candidatus Formimonas warabiya]
METGKECLEKKVTDLITALKPLAESYRLLVSSADEFNRITLAHRKDLEDAVHRADDLGEIIDKVIDTLDDLLDKWVHEMKRHPEDPVHIPVPKIERS